MVEGRGSWRYAFLWAIPLFAWFACLGVSLYYVKSQAEWLRSEALRPRENLTNCLTNGGPTEFTDPVWRAECQRKYVADREQSRASLRYLGLEIGKGVVGAASCVLVAILYRRRVPSGKRAGLRGVCLALILSMLAAYAYIQFVASIMPRTD